MHREVSRHGDFINLEKVISEECIKDSLFAESIKHGLSSLDWLKGRSGVDPGLKLTIYYNLIPAFLQTHHYRKARKYCIAEAIEDHHFQDNEISRIQKKLLRGDYLDKSYNFISYTKIAQTYFLEFPDNVDSLKLALQFVQLGEEQLIQECNSIEENRRIWLVGYSKDLFKMGVHITYRLYTLTNNEAYLRDFIRYTEQMKAIILEGDSDFSIQEYIPEDSIISLDKFLRSRVRIHRQSSGNTDSLKYYLDRISQLNDFYWETYPEYLEHRIFGQVHTDYIIPPKACLLGYDLIDSFLYVQIHTPTEIGVRRIGMNHLRQESLNRLTGLQSDPNPPWDSLNSLTDQISNLIWPRIPVATDRLILSFSGSIGRLSFDALRFRDEDTTRWVSDKYSLTYVPGLRFVDTAMVQDHSGGIGRLAVFTFSNKETINNSFFDAFGAIRYIPGKQSSDVTISIG